MNTEALTRLVTLLSKPLPRKTRFSIGTWKDKTSCGTVMCAAGLAASNRWFILRGLSLKPMCGGLAPTYKGLYRYDALSSFFGIMGGVLPGTSSLPLATATPRHVATSSSASRPCFLTTRTPHLV